MADCCLGGVTSNNILFCARGCCPHQYDGKVVYQSVREGEEIEKGRLIQITLKE